MSLDVNLMALRPCSVYSGNVTHNLGKMAAAVNVGVNLTLYDVLWRPEEHGIFQARTIVDYLYTGWRELSRHPEKYRKYNPENGWGSYEGLVDFVRVYHSNCMENLDAKIEVSR